MNYKLTIRRRKKDGSLETATYNLEHVHSSGGDDEQMRLLAHLEIQANAGCLPHSHSEEDPQEVRVWVDERE